MTVEANIPVTDIEGEPVNVCTQYDVHTISLVGLNALGRNLTKLKSLEVPNKEGESVLSTQEKIDKAKELDAKEAEVAVETAAPEVELVEEQTAEVEEVEEVEVAEEVVAEEVVVEVEEAEVVEEQVEKVKMFTVEELGEANKLAFDTMAKLFKEIAAKAPESDQWEVYEVIQGALYDVDWAVWSEADGMWNKLWDEVWSEVTNRVNKSKALKVQSAVTPVDALKAFAETNPEMAAALQSQIAAVEAAAASEKEKALELESEKKAMIRAKALEAGTVKFKRLSTEENTTDQIVDALAEIETLSPDSAKVINKALETASNILMAGELFTDLGSTNVVVQQSEAEYVAEKAKSLYDEKIGKNIQTNLAAERATVRQTEEYQALFG